MYPFVFKFQQNITGLYIPNKMFWQMSILQGIIQNFMPWPYFNYIIQLNYVTSCKHIRSTHSAQLKHPWAQMYTLLDRSSVIFKFPSLRFNFYQGPPSGWDARGNLSRQIFSSVVFFPPSMALTRLPSVRIFLSLKLGVGSPNPPLPTRAVITKQNHTEPRFG